MIPEQLVRRQINYDTTRRAWFISYDYQCKKCNIWKSATAWVGDKPTKEILRYYDESAIPEVIRLASKDCTCHPDLDEDIPRVFLVDKGREEWEQKQNISLSSRQLSSSSGLPSIG